MMLKQLSIKFNFQNRKQSIDIPRKATYISLQNEKPKSTSRGNSYHMVKPDNYLSK